MTKTPVYLSAQDSAPDSAFVAGELRHLVLGNRGRLLDARRTPVTVVDVTPDRGSFAVQIEAFEDAGARWELSLTEVGSFQFARDGRAVGGAELAALERGVERFGRELVIECSPRARQEALERLGERRERARQWLRERESPAHVHVAERVQRREGDPALFRLLGQFLAERGLEELERRFTATFVSNPRSGEVVKGHAIVLAELGLCPYHGEVPRDTDLFEGQWSRSLRAEHLLWRLAFTQELLLALGVDELELYRASASDHPLRTPRPSSFVSATFSRTVAEAHFAGGPSTRAAVLFRQALPVDRALMSFLETEAMNERFQEAEAVLICDPGNYAF
jgi:hypothetical protein